MKLWTPDNPLTEKNKIMEEDSERDKKNQINSRQVSHYPDYNISNDVSAVNQLKIISWSKNIQ